MPRKSFPILYSKDYEREEIEDPNEAIPFTVGGKLPKRK
jgi:hypothetical protein